ncbi:MAG: ferredoxin--NADP reductase [Terriglobia bacterium]
MTPAVHHAILRRTWGSSARARHFEFEMANGHRFEFHAGQFISLHLNSNGERVARPYSIAARRAEHCFELCVNVSPQEPEGDAWFRSLGVGERVEFTGPFGSFKLRQPAIGVSAFIATGTGIAPLRAMVHELYRTHKPEETWLIFGARREADILYREEFENLAHENPTLHFIPTLSRSEPGWKGHCGYVQIQIRKYLTGKQGLHAYVCGSPAMVEGVRTLLETMGYPPEAVSFERFE